MMDVHNCRGACVALEGNRNCPQLIDPITKRPRTCTTQAVDVSHDAPGPLTRIPQNRADTALCDFPLDRTDYVKDAAARV